MSIYFGADSTTQHSAGVGASSAGKILDLQQYQATGSISHSSNTFTDIPSFSHKQIVKFSYHFVHLKVQLQLTLFVLDLLEQKVEPQQH